MNSNVLIEDNALVLNLRRHVAISLSLSCLSDMCLILSKLHACKAGEHSINQLICPYFSVTCIYACIHMYVDENEDYT